MTTVVMSGLQRAWSLILLSLLAVACSAAAAQQEGDSVTTTTTETPVLCTPLVGLTSAYTEAGVRFTWEPYTPGRAPAVSIIVGEQTVSITETSVEVQVNTWPITISVYPNCPAAKIPESERYAEVFTAYKQTRALISALKDSMTTLEAQLTELRQQSTVVAEHSHAMGFCAQLKTGLQVDVVFSGLPRDPGDPEHYDREIYRQTQAAKVQCEDGTTFWLGDALEDDVRAERYARCAVTPDHIEDWVDDRAHVYAHCRDADGVHHLNIYEDWEPHDPDSHGELPTGTE